MRRLLLALSLLTELLWWRSLRLELVFRLHDHVYVVKVGPQTFELIFVLELDLLDKFIELTLRRADLLFKQFGTILQVATNITHR